ncbi:ABC transporter permease [Elizabethkingia meningoseptica]|uniref:ABC transporter permease n=1 Tax=Elizabethkingia meningoseptica TaxID=238 RepID=UPI0023AEDD86|nr:ABC transporter permease [Elizabethkingia meningoseptica]MDE5430817.1 ABC transporter permease [Elizabethkingia meningoseptica]MDE5438834.1 ABC transporter permease [Elizabethkingia meningoseptica]MDE5507969.1 ABC transporter permease [Elizabethkingia meningoseptica]MDE5516163.1 ABC transporter permease [Elizabethkingia meningoseptica]MDE5526428.1 ABC transporter permease [Elizabethkingia meningoseptica]
MIKNWLKIAFINYKKNWLSTVINLFGLTIGLTGFMLILMHWNDEYSYESWNPEKQNIYYLQAYNKNGDWWNNNMSHPIPYYADKLIPEAEDYLLISGDGGGQIKSSQGKSVFSTKGLAVTEHFFNFFPFKLQSGSYKDALTDKHKIAISSDLSTKLFGTVKAAGEKVTIEDSLYVVTAVYEIPKANTVAKPEYVVLSKEAVEARKLLEEKNDPSWGSNNYQALLKLKKGADPVNVAEQIYQKEILGIRYKNSTYGDISSKQALEMYGPNKFELTPLDKTKLHAKGEFFYKKGDYKTILILFWLSVLIILLSIINFVNLTTAQASQRAKEVGVRKALGSNRTQLIIQFLIEAFILCMLAYSLSLVLVEIILPFFNKFLNKEMLMDSWTIYLYSGLMILVVSVIAGLIPAVYLANFKPINTLKGNFSRSRHGVLLRNGILGLQLVISSFFIISGFIIYQQVAYMMDKELGFNGKQMLQISMNQASKKPWLKYERLREELKKIQGVTDVSYGEAIPTPSGASSTIEYMGKSILAQHGSMDYNFLPFSEVTIVEGRNITPQFASDSINTLIVNEAFAKRMNWTAKEAVGKEVHPGFVDGSTTYKIVGVTEDYNMWGVAQEVPPISFFHYKESEWKRYYMRTVLVKISENDIPGTLERLKAFWTTKGEPGYPFDYYFVDQQFAKSFTRYQKQKTLFTLLNGVVLVVALLGLFALSSLIIDQKLRDVAIKKTLGASSGVLIKDLTKKFLWITAIAVLFSIPVSYYFMNEWLKDFAYRIEMPWWPYILSLIILLLLTFLVVSIKAYRATKVELVRYLKYE